MVDTKRYLSHEELIAWDKEHFWHPFTQMKEYTEYETLLISEGNGNYIKDIFGKEYFDGISSLWVTLHGHRKKEIDEAIIDQVRKIAHSTTLGMSNVPAVVLAKRLVDLIPSDLTKVFYSDTGACAMEIAAKMVFQYWQQKEGASKAKRGFITLEHGYHGDTIGAMSIGGIDLYRQVYEPIMFPVLHAPSPYCYRCSLKKEYPGCKLACADELERIVRKHHNELAALFMESMVQGAGGMIVFPPGYLKKAGEICKKYGILLVLDEVATGFGRTGKLFACEHEGVVPDVMSVGKGITGGYLPLAATFATDELYRCFWGDYAEYKTFFHGHTYTGNPIACAAALANLDVFEKEKVLHEMQGKIARLQEGLIKFHELPFVGDTRQLGFIVGIELVKDKKTKEQFPPEKRMGMEVCYRLREMGVSLRPLGDVLVLMPPLSIRYEEIDMLLDKVFRAIHDVIA
ncbi:MAG: adenosylmethionine--8-amino-7-oxononanoate transaminase, partial [Thermodesulfobacteriota bacterium]|nr:adenosylmethionine--8-amino-7-oxononanoate transaminase [Thermodesulfobacteriota bacterium]